MWVLSPLLPAGASQRAAEEGASLPNPVQFLTSGSITIGRPGKKGGTTGRADVLIFGESSVSTLHATLTIEPSQGRGQHGRASIADRSKYGTTVKRSDGAEQRTQPGEAVWLQPGDVLRFGTKSRYKLQQVPLKFCALGAADGELEAAAAACNAELAGACGADATHVVAADGGELSPAALLALALQGERHVPVVTPAWVAAVAAAKAHAGALPDPAPFAPRQLMLPPAPGGGGEESIDPASWQPPPAQLLRSYRLVMPPNHNGDLARAAQRFAPEALRKSAPLLADELAAEERRAAGSGVAAVAVVPNDGAEEHLARYRGAAAAVTEAQLLRAIATGNAASLEAAVAAFRRAARAKEAGAGGGAGGGSEDNEATEAEETEEGEDGGSDEALSDRQLEALEPVVHATRGRPQPQQQQQVAAAAAKGGAGRTRQGGTSPATKASPATPRHAARASKRGAAAISPSGDAAAPAAAGAGAGAGASEQAAQGCKRRKVAVEWPAAAAEAAPPAAQAPGQGAAAAAAPGAARGAPAASLAGAMPGMHQRPAEQQQQQQEEQGSPEAGGSGARVVFAQLVARATAAPPPQRASAAAANHGRPAVVNFKAFRQKRLLGAAAAQQRQQRQQQQCRGPPVPLVPYERELKGPDTDAFLKDERQRIQRLKAADDLFNATIRPKAARKGGK